MTSFLDKKQETLIRAGAFIRINMVFKFSVEQKRPIMSHMPVYFVNNFFMLHASTTEVSYLFGLE